MEQFKIYVNRLKNGLEQHYDEKAAPDFLGVQDESLSFKENIHITGSTYLTDDHLITHLDIDTTACIPCSICNETVRIPICIKNFCLSKPLIEIKGPFYDILDDIRESILLQAPQFAECNNGQCPNRQFVQEFLGKKSKEKKNPASDSMHFPFSEI